MQKRIMRCLTQFAAFALVIGTGIGAPLQLQTFTLPNGLRVVLNEDHSAPLVAVNLWYHVGSKNEKPGRTGFAHLFEHMLFSGSRNVGNNEHFRYVQSVGGVLNGSTAFDRTNYYETVPSNYLEMALWLEADRLGFFLPALDQARLDVQKNVVKEERRQRYENAPYGTAWETLLAGAFPKEHPYSWPTIGSMTDLTAAQIDDVKEFFRLYYAPNNAVLTLVGDFDPANARMLVEKYFASIPRGANVPRVELALVEQTEEKRLTMSGAVQLPRVYRLYHVPGITSSDWLAADLVTYVLAGGKASRLERALVFDQKIAQDVSASVRPGELDGTLTITATAKPGVSLDRIESAIDAEIEKLARSGPTADELTRVKNFNLTDIARNLESFASRADTLGMLATYFGDPAVVNDWPARYDRITADQVRAAAAKYLTRSNRTTLHYLANPSKPEAR